MEDCPTRVWAVVDYEPPVVRLELDRERRELRTVARDFVTPAHALAFRYRGSQGAWSEPGPARTFGLDELGPEPFLEVEVADEAGHSAQARFGDVATVAPGTPLAPSDSGGCSTGAPAVLALFALAALRRRRRL